MMGVQLHLAVRPNRKEMGMPQLQQMGVKNTMITGPLSGELALVTTLSPSPPPMNEEE